MSGVRSFSKISLLSERSDVIKFVKNACEPAVPISVIETFDDFWAAVTGDSLVIIDASFFAGNGNAFLNPVKMICSKIICLLPIDIPQFIASNVEQHFCYSIPFPISIEKFRLMVIRYQNLINNKPISDIPLLAEGDVVPESFFGYFCGCSELIRGVRKRLLEVSTNKAPVLLLGETGTGKNTAANVIHSLSDNKQKKLISLPLSTVVDSLAGSTFFGHTKGSFTSADCDCRGVFEAANGSTLFLDQLGTASLDIQAMLLTVLETGNFKKVGDEEEQHCDVRLIFATNADLSRMLKEGTFRSDLYFRICDNIIRIPPIRERREDIHAMVENFIKKDCFSITRQALECLENYSWPGNIRELHKCLLRAMSNNPSHVIAEKDLDFGAVSILQ